MRNFWKKDLFVLRCWITDSANRFTDLKLDFCCQCVIIYSSTFFTTLFTIISENLQLISANVWRKSQGFFFLVKWKTLCFYFHNHSTKVHDLSRKFLILFCDHLKKFVINFWIDWQNSKIFSMTNWPYLRFFFSAIIWRNFRLHSTIIW